METAPHPAVQRRQTTALVVAALLALALVAAMITRTSEAAFTATTDNTGNFFNGGTVTLSDDDGATALFAVTAMEPGEVVSDCLTVSYDGTITSPNTVVVYGDGLYTDVAGADAASVGLSDWLLVTIDEGTLATPGDCATFSSTSTILTSTTVATFNTTNTNYAGGVGTWTPTATGETTTYQVTVELDAATPGTEQGARTENVGFVWEIQS